jgi:hypothetical protein
MTSCTSSHSGHLVGPTPLISSKSPPGQRQHACKTNGNPGDENPEIEAQMVLRPEDDGPCSLNLQNGKHQSRTLALVQLTEFQNGVA